jgi:hypothetical protein
MNTTIEKIRCFRIFLLGQIEGLTTEQLNQIPAGYNNNIIWNLAHLTAVAQMVCYTRSGIAPAVEDTYITPYLTGTKPEAPLSEPEIAAIKQLLILSAEQLQDDYNRQLFVHYTPSIMIPKVYGFEVTNIDEALNYLLYHEGVHSGYILALRNIVVHREPKE